MRNLGLIVTLWLAAIALPTNSLALGLGEIEVNSFLNQPLNAEIEVISARPGEIDDLLVSLASREAFTRAGLSRPRHLSDLRFAVRKNDEGDQAVILVTTKGAIKEPFLNFLIEADWSKGRVLREFTVLLDPPFYADTPAPVETAVDETVEPVTEDSSVSEIMEQSPSVTSTQSTEQITEPIALSDSDTPVVSDEVAVDEPEPIIEGDIQIVKGDTLWSIATRYKDSKHSMAQVMLAFQRTNPGAFNNGNINNLKVGAVLRAPSAFEMDALGKQEAFAQVLEQNGLWDDYVARVTGTSPSIAAQETGDGTPTNEASSELSLLLPGDGSTESTGISDGADLNELRNKLAMAEEELEASRIENTELESRIAELQARLSKVEELQKMVEIEDDSLAQLQAQQADQVEQPVVEEVLTPADTAETMSAESVTEEMKADEEALLEELLAEEAAAQAQEEAAISEPIVTVESDTLVDESAVTEDALVDQSQEQTPPAPVIITDPISTEPSMFDGILPPDIISLIPSVDSIIGDPIILGAIGGVILLLLILVILKRRKGSEEEESSITVSGADDMFAGDDEEELTPIHLAETAEPADTNIKIPTEEDMVETAPEEEDDFSSTAIISKGDMPEPEAPAPAAGAAEQDDVLNEVDVYLAYGLYDNAEDLLKTNLTENPDRADYRSKLLDTYFATKNVDAFVGEAQSLKSMGDSAGRYWDRVQVMGYELAPDNALFSDAKDSGLSAADLEIAKPQAADFDLGSSEDDDTNFSTTDFNLGEEDTGGDFSETQTFGDTQVKDGADGGTQEIPSLDELPDLEDEDDTNVRAEADAELPDDIGDELEFSLDDDAGGDDLPESFDLETDDEPDSATDDADIDIEDISMEFDVEDEADNDAEDLSEIDFGAEFEAALDEADELDVGEGDEIPFEVDLDEPEAVPDHEKTAIVDTTPGYEETAVIDTTRLADDAAVKTGETRLDLGMDDTSIAAGDDVVIDIGDDDDNEDISIVNFGGDDFDVDDEEINIEDSISMEIDVNEEESKTGTFAPGDFDEPTAAVDSLGDIDDIGDLMLPDDVDEVSTKLDLARAFIDMGDTEGARGSLEEVMSEGNDEQKAEAKALLDGI